jgi:hypothetical protein
MNMIRLANEQLEASLEQLEDVHFVNPAIDSGTVHSLMAVHCLVSNPFCLVRPIVIDLCNNFSFTKEDSASLFKSLIQRLTGENDSERAPHVHAKKMIWNAHLMYTREK